MSAPTTIPATPAPILAQIAQLPELSMADIKALWKCLFARPTPTSNRQFLERRLAYKLQEIEFKKVNPELMERNQRRINALLETGVVKQRDRDYRPQPGTVLTREYQAVEYRVTVTLDSQYEYQGRLYPSLSMIAREITGTRWSGPLFFGLKALSKPKSKGVRR